jgi:hypothetical protein
MQAELRHNTIDYLETYKLSTYKLSTNTLSSDAEDLRLVILNFRFKTE